jgi:hypothetical protein
MEWPPGGRYSLPGYHSVPGYHSRPGARRSGLVSSGDGQDGDSGRPLCAPTGDSLRNLLDQRSERTLPTARYLGNPTVRSPVAPARATRWYAIPDDGIMHGLLRKCVVLTTIGPGGRPAR